MIQGVIIRVASNAFSLKAMAVTIAAAMIAFAGAGSSGMEIFPLAGLLPVLLFWIMDAQYLRVEKCYRCLYDAVRNNSFDDKFSMDYKPFKKDVEKLFHLIFWNWSVTPLFSAVSLSLFATYYFLNNGS